MSSHTSMLWLPSWVEYLGVNVITLDGWEDAQGEYFWTDLDTGQRSRHHSPMSYMVHHTAGSISRPEVRNSAGKWSKANCWAGIWDGESETRPVLRQGGAGIPTVVFTSAGPARVSSGFGHGPTLGLVNNDVRVNWDQQHSDTKKAANRYAWNCETVHAGNGSSLDPGVHDAIVKMGLALSLRFEWVPWRTIGHLTWTQRKVDPFWNQERDAIVAIQDRIEEELAMTYKGVLNVPDESWAKGVVDWGIDNGIIVVGDEFPDDWTRDEMTDGRFWTFLNRFDTNVVQTEDQPA